MLPSTYIQSTADTGELPYFTIVDTITPTLSLSLRSRGNETECVGTVTDEVITLFIHLSMSSWSMQQMRDHSKGQVLESYRKPNKEKANEAKESWDSAASNRKAMRSLIKKGLTHPNTHDSNNKSNIKDRNLICFFNSHSMLVQAACLACWPGWRAEI